MRKLFISAIFFAAAAFGYTVQVDVNDVGVRPAMDAAFVGYDVVTLKGEDSLPLEPGEPALPGVVVTVALPKGTRIESVEVSHGEPVTLPGTYRVMPTQEPTPVSSAEPRPTPPAAGVYASVEPFPGKLAYSFESGNMAGYGVGSVALAPVQYVPATGKITVYPIIDFKLNLRRADVGDVYPKVRADWVDRDIRASLAKTVINPWEVVPPGGVRLVGGKDGSVEDIFPYLIITNDAMAEKAGDLADWKTKKGYRATVVTTSFIEAAYPGCDLPEKIRNCIKDYYENKSTYFVCLVGTDSVVPFRRVYDPVYPTAEGDNLVPTDNYYGCLDGDFDADGDHHWGEHPDDEVDWVYDVLVGRIQATEAEELAWVIDKTLCYEGAEASGEANPYDYQNSVILAGGFLSNSINDKYLMEYVRDNYLVSSYWSFTELWDDVYPGGAVFNAANFIMHMNEGKALIAHAAHSSTHVLGTNSGRVSRDNILDLDNKPRFSGVLYSLGCYTSNVDFPDNCAASFVKSEGGGVNAVGNTRFGFYGGNPAIGYSADFLRSYFEMIGLHGFHVSGKVFILHKHKLQEAVESWVNRYIYFELTHTGDPDVWIPNENICKPKVTYGESIPTGSQIYRVHVDAPVNGNVEGALVCVWKDNDVYAAATADAGGDVAFDIDPRTAGTMSLTVSAYNMRTFEAKVAVGSEGVKLTSFAGRRTEAGVVLDWTVDRPGEVDYFDLYRRPAGSLAAPADNTGPTLGAPATASGAAAAREVAAGGDGWVKLNAEPVRGRSPYRYLDRDVEAIFYDYKLEAVQAGEPDELGTTRVDGALPVAFAFGVAPNPATTAARVLVDLPETAAVKVILYDLSGRRVATVVDRVLSEGKNAAALDVAGMPAGVYILRLEAGGRTAAKRLAVVH